MGVDQFFHLVIQFSERNYSCTGNKSFVIRYHKSSDQEYMKSIYCLVVLFLVQVVALSCKKATASDAKVMAQEEEKITSDNLDIQWPQPTKYIEGIPIFDKFSDLEPIFRMDNDTSYVINFWATWCKPCIEELPYFEEFRTKHTNDKVRVILCSLDFPKQIESKLIPFVKKHQLKSDVVVLLDGKFNNWIDKVSDEWSGSLPATYIYQKDRKQFFEKSFKNLDELEQVMQSYL